MGSYARNSNINQYHHKNLDRYKMIFFCTIYVDNKAIV